MITARVIVAIPTLVADEALDDCFSALDQQTFRDFAVILIDNSGQGLTRRFAQRQAAPPGPGAFPLHIIENPGNVGFGSAINQAMAASQGDYVATLNDDCVPRAEWLAELVAVIEREYEIGMCASQVRMAGANAALLDSAGMVISRDAASKQRGFLESPANFSKDEEVLCPSASAALYRREMLEDVGGFDESYFLYCEDTDLGLRARWAGWQARYAAKAVVTHRYSHSAGRVSPLKAYLVERNRLVTAVKNLPARDLWLLPFAGLIRYSWHVVGLLSGRGATAQYHKQEGGGLSLFWYVAKAHGYLLATLPRVLSRRRHMKRRMQPRQVSMIFRRHRISLRRVALL
ncbi:MAG: glycosyltransferase family 2 protein [Bryobacteraceae bacterium]